jgi:hypothetical protein
MALNEDVASVEDRVSVGRRVHRQRTSGVLLIVGDIWRYLHRDKRNQG